MCSIFDELINLHHSNVAADSEDPTEWCETFSFIARLLAYIAVLALLVLITIMILKYLMESDDNQVFQQHFQLQSSPATETTPLCPAKWEPITYSACESRDNDDIESGSCSGSSSEELYDGKICVVCYDEERNCFFIPCGHCATCHDCALRICEGDSRTCPVCRRLVRKVRKWFTP